MRNRGREETELGKAYSAPPVMQLCEGGRARPQQLSKRLEEGRRLRKGVLISRGGADRVKEMRAMEREHQKGLRFFRGYRSAALRVALRLLVHSDS
jgi:hypothetical protein